VLEGNPRLIIYKYFFNRKVAFLKEAHAVVLCPGGFGTLDEAMETLTLVQTGKRDPLPLVLLDEPGGSYWSGCRRFFEDELLARGFITYSDSFLFEQTDSVDEALRVINQFYHRYHSLRYVDGRLVLRLTSPIDQESVQKLKDNFSTILIPEGDIVLSGALPAEVDEPDIAHLQRLVMDFDRKNFGQLRKLIDVINGF
jgi:hypothetical protein